jgi:hypothetical protein
VVVLRCSYLDDMELFFYIFGHLYLPSNKDGVVPVFEKMIDEAEMQNGHSSRNSSMEV